MTSAEIKALKKRAEALVRAAYDIAKGEPDMRRHFSATYCNLPVSDERQLGLYVKQPGGGFMLHLTRPGPFVELGTIDWHQTDRHTKQRRAPMTLGEEGDTAAVIAALAELEQDIAGAMRAAIDAVVGEQRAAEARRLEAKEQRRLEALADRLAYAAAFDEDVAAIQEAAAHIRKLVMVASMIEDGSRERHRAEGHHDKRPVFIPGEAGIAVIRSDRVQLAREVRPQFGLSIIGILAHVAQEPEGLTAAGDLPALRALLEANRDNPFEAAARVGLCFFCAIPLTDPESRRRGYGPDCAKRYRQPWGARS